MSLKWKNRRCNSWRGASLIAEADLVQQPALGFHPALLHPAIRRPPTAPQRYACLGLEATAKSALTRNEASMLHKAMMT